MPINATKAALLAALLLLSSAPAFAEDEGIQFFPPKNLEAGLGFLYFDAGGLGKQSVYAVPVQSQELVAAVRELKDAIQKTSGAIQCSTITSPLGGAGMSDFIVICTNILTGTVCQQCSTDITKDVWSCHGKNINSGYYPSPQ